MFKELTVADWEVEIDRGLDYRKAYGLEDYWNENEALFYNSHEMFVEAGPNIVISTGDALLSTLCVPNPYLTTRSRMPGFIQKSRLVEQVDNELMEDLKLTETMETASLHCFLWGKAVLKVGYDSEFGFNPELDWQGPGQSGMTLTSFDKNENRIEFSQAKPGMPWVAACLPHDIVVPWGVKEIEDSPWVIHRVVRHIDDVKADPKYSNKKNLRPCMSMEDYTKSYKTVLKPYRMGTQQRSVESAGRSAEYCELWEIHDRRTGKVKVIATGHDKFLRNEHDALQIDGLPFVSFSFVPRAKDFWTTPDAYYLKAHQAELMDIALQRTKHRRISLLKFLYAEDAFDEDQLEELLSAKVGAGVKVKGSTEIDKAVKTLQPYPANNLLSVEEEDVRRNARDTVGFSRNQFGEYESTGRRTAFEAKLVQGASDLRSNRRQTALKKAYIEVFRKINATIFEYWKTPKITEILGPDGAAIWQPYTGESLAGEYVYGMGFSNEPEESLTQRKQNAFQLYMMLAKDPYVDPVEARKMLIDSFNDPNFSRVFNQQLLAQAPSSGMKGPGNASLQLPMSAVSSFGGGSPAGGDGGQDQAM